MAKMMDRDAGEFSLRVRRCGACGERDLTSAVGTEVVMDDRPWSCSACGGRTWSTARMSFPADASGRCPHLRAGALDARP